MNIKEAKALIKQFPANAHFMIWENGSRPNNHTASSLLLSQLASEKNFQFKHIGLNSCGDESFIDKLSELTACPSSGYLLFTGLELASPKVLGLAYELILDHKIGDYNLPSGWWIVLAGSIDDRANYPMPRVLYNKFSHLELDCAWNAWRSMETT